MTDELDAVLDKLAKNVEAAVHAMYRGDTRSATVKVRTSGFVRDAAEALRARGAVAGVGRPSAAAMPVVATGVGGPATAAGEQLWTRDEAEAVMKCVMAWLPMGTPTSATPDSRCVAAGREMVPSWGQRERARAALRKVPSA